MLGVITTARRRVLCKDGDLISSQMIMPCFLLSLRAGSYGVTTRSRDKWITTDYAHRTEINSVAIVATTTRKTGIGAEGEGERAGGKLEKSTSPTYPSASRWLRRSKWEKGGGGEMSLMGWLMRGSEDNIVIISSCGGGGVVFYSADGPRSSKDFKCPRRR